MKIDNSQNSSKRWLFFTLLVLSIPTALLAQTPANQPPANNEYLEGGVLWQQTSGEWRGLAYQAFALGRMVLDRDLRMNRRDRKPRAIIVDLDETILDNSRNEGRLLKDRINFNQKDWND
jgi:predicted secreted acid phosphatase